MAKPNGRQKAEDLPPELKRVWQWFCDLSTTRPSGMGFVPISYAEIAEYGRLMGISFRKWEVVALRRLDIRAIEAAMRRAKNKTNIQNETPASDGHGVASLLRGFKRKPKASR
ncbi:phage tail assembly chaperone [Brucella anthropi]|uniref:phage tail assembly chaperone n=1 Tax=Brucella anthropi TaxID=529 RepID=UPI003EE4180C